MSKYLWNGLYLFAGLIISIHFFDGWRVIPGLEALGSREERLSCPEEVTGLTVAQKNEKQFLQISGVEMNRVSFPLNGEDMLEYCVTIQNFSGNIGNVALKVKFLGEDENVLAEVDDLVMDIPGKRAKTIYGSTFVLEEISEDVTGIRVSGAMDF